MPCFARARHGARSSTKLNSHRRRRTRCRRHTYGRSTAASPCPAQGRGSETQGSKKAETPWPRMALKQRRESDWGSASGLIELAAATRTRRMDAWKILRLTPSPVDRANEEQPHVG